MALREPMAGKVGMNSRAAPPTATYRLQFSRHFTFAQAAKLLPYLRDLGISHIYASPYLKARPGSTHGYDIVDHNALNPEIGTWQDFEFFCTELRRTGMGQILDFVPNHMGIGYADNELWLDVLEWGRSSPFATFFDINWEPRQPTLRDKVLLPLLGDQYGNVLERGQLTLQFDAETGCFSIWYFEHRFPIHPSCYAAILEQLTGDRVSLCSDMMTEMRSITKTFADMFPTIDTAAARATVKTLQASLARIAGAGPDWAARLHAAAAAFNGQAEQPKSFQPLHALLERQAYRLAFWRVAAEEINYRRFFDINELAGICIERPDVFPWIHRLIGRLIAEGKLQGLRLDHIDGLFDPVAYLTRLQCFAAEHLGNQPCSSTSADNDAVAPEQRFYILVEKILARHERLREDWPVAGTTGYECLNLVNGLFVDPNGERPLDRIYRHFLDRPTNFDEVLYDCKSLIIDTILGSELSRLSAELDDLSERHWSTRDYTQERLRAALKEVVAAFPVYRTYINEAGIAPDDRRDLDWAVSQARKTYAGLDPEILDFIHAALTAQQADHDSAFDRQDVLRFAMRFQQYTGPVMAKSLEDTSFYRYNRLLSLNEVGGDPRQFGVSITAFHWLAQERAKHHPNALSTSATHDTKRGADARARINILSEIPEVWRKRVRRWVSLNRFKRRKVDDRIAPTRNDEYMIYQMLLGAWPASLVGTMEPDRADLAAFQQRMRDAVVKAIREAKRRTSWYNPNDAYELACITFIERLLDFDHLNPFLDDFVPFQSRVARIGVLNGLCQIVVTLTMPGVPDIYQGCELWDFNLMDPDNRRPIDFDMRQRLLADISETRLLPPARRLALLREWLESWQNGRIKLALIAAILALRQHEPNLFRNGSYEPLTISGPHSDHLLGFSRRFQEKLCIVIVARFFNRLTSDSPRVYPGGSLWIGTEVILPEKPASLVNILTGAVLHVPDARARVDEILADLPAAVLVERKEPANPT